MLDTNHLKGKRLIAPDKNNKEAILEDEIGRGGEGVICTIKGYPDAVAKIYYEDKRDKDRENKIKFLIDKFLKSQVNENLYKNKLKLNEKFYKNLKKELTIPITRLYYENEFVGYVMRKVNGRALKTFLAGDKRLLALYPNAKRTDLVDLCINFLVKVDYLHSLNILIGDINLNNILADKNDLTKCYLVDIDAAQVDNMPCPVGTDEFTPPNLQGKNFKNVLRTKEDEYFSIAIALFMILFLGKHPFSRFDGSSPAENIKKHLFPYPLGRNYKELHQNAPRGFYKNIWTHITKKLQEKFYETFVNDKRFTPAEWIEALKGYKWAIEKKGIYTNELAPVAFRATKEPVKVKCESCSIEFDMEKGYLEYLKSKSYKILCNKCYDVIYGINLAKKNISNLKDKEKKVKNTSLNNKNNQINTNKNKKIYNTAYPPYNPYSPYTASNSIANSAANSAAQSSKTNNQSTNTVNNQSQQNNKKSNILDILKNILLMPIILPIMLIKFIYEAIVELILFVIELVMIIFNIVYFLFRVAYLIVMTGIIGYIAFIIGKAIFPHLF